jgi:hypothetical protein
MQAILDQVIEICLIAMPVLFVLDIAAKVADERRAARVEPSKIEIESVVEMEVEVPDVDLPSYEELFAVEVEPAVVEPIAAVVLAQQAMVHMVLGDVWADDEVDQVTDAGASDEAVVEVFQQGIVNQALNGWSIRELKKMASECGIPKYSRMSKAELIAALA